jgi:hypothetical protein
MDGVLQDEDRQVALEVKVKKVTKFANLNESKDLKSDLVEIEEIAAIAADFMMMKLGTV